MMDRGENFPTGKKSRRKGEIMDTNLGAPGVVMIGRCDRERPSGTMH